VSRELALLFACVRWPDSTRKAEAIRTVVAAGVNWATVHALAARHRVSALVYHGLLLAEVDIGEPNATRMRQAAERVSLLELQVAGDLRLLVAAIKAVGVTPIVLKGLSIAALAFGRLGLRYNRDIDLLIPLAALPDVASVLQSLGYGRTEPPPSVTPSQLSRWTRRQKDAVFIDERRASIVELHWRLFDNYKLLPVDAGMEADLVDIGPDFQVCTLPRDLNVIYLCLHGAQHAWSRLKWLADIGAILQGMSASDIEAIYHKAVALGVSRPFVQACVLCATILETPIPRQVLDRGDDWRVRWLVQTAFHSLSVGGAEEMEDQVAGSTRKNLSHYLLRDDFGYRLEEAAFDLTELPSGRWLSTPVYLAPLVRVGAWLARQGRLWRGGRRAARSH